MVVHDLRDNREPESHAVFLGGEERIEDLFAESLGDAWPGVLEVDLDAAPAVGVRRRHFDPQFSVAGHGLVSILRQVGEDLFAEPRVHRHLRQVRGVLSLDLDPGFRKAVPHRLQRLVDERRQLLRAKIEVEGPGKVEKAADQRVELVDLARNIAGELGGERIRRP